MCGILMALGEPKLGFQKALELMAHRGPDALKHESFNSENNTLMLGHVRLSIHDLSERSEQPFISACGNYVLIFNGEIYNYEELKEKHLSTEQLHTTSDTEVLLLLLIKFGTKILNDLDGMFSFCFYDKTKQEVLVARDQLGIKPLYYTFENGQLILASELKPVLSLMEGAPKVSNVALYEFMRNSFVYEPETGFESVLKLESGHFFKIDIRKRVKPKTIKYWSPIDPALNKNFSLLPSLNNDLNTLVNESVELQQKSDVPVGLFFSGGVDSTILLTKLSNNNNVDILSVKHAEGAAKNSGATDDFYYASKIANILSKKLKPVEFSPVVNGAEFLKEVERAAIGVEELVSDFTYSVSKKLSLEARMNNSVVMLSGMGADEIFAGYEKYRLLKYPRLHRLVLFFIKPILKRNKKFSKKFDRLLAYFNSNNFGQSYTNLLGYFNADETRLLFDRNLNLENDYLSKLDKFAPCEMSPLRKAMLLDLKGFLQHNFTVGDKSSMAASIELRVPLATKKLMEESFRTPESELINLKTTKVSLRKLLKNYVPRKYLERKKAGFHPPMDTIINQIGKQEIEKVFMENKLYDLLPKDFCLSVTEFHFSKERNNTYQIFQLLFLSYWYKNFIVEGSYAAG